MLAALLAVGQVTMSARASMVQANETSRTISLAIAVGDVLHETQKERGGSAVYLSSNGSSFSSELRAQHDATDVAIQALTEKLEEIGADVDPTIVAAVEAVLDDLGDVPGRRVAVLALDAELGPTIAAYTATNQDLLSVVITIEQGQSTSETSRGTLAYRSVLQGKEAAGIMRAQFANVFTNDAFGEGQLSLLIKLQTRRDVALAQFADFATDELKAEDAARRAGTAFNTVSALESDAITNGVAGFDVDPVAWFGQKTAYIDELKSLEDGQAQSVLDGADDTSSIATRAFWSLILAASVLIGAIVAFSVLVVSTIVDALRRISEHAEKIAAGNLQMDDLEIPGDDEIASLGKKFDSMTDTLMLLGRQIDAIASVDLDDGSIEETLPGQLGDKMARLADATRSQLELAAKEEQHMSETVMLLGEISNRASLLLANSTVLSSVSDDLTLGAGETSDQASSVSAAAEEASAIANSVAIALAQLQESVTEIATSAGMATATAQRAVAVSDETRATIERLGESSTEIGQVVDLISSIAEDTNVLALNATIEAARAGEAGKGFAVVANEVKTLANQTAEATADIKRRVKRIQDDSRQAVAAIDSVSSVIHEISDSQHSIASAVEEQTATTAEIASAVEDVAKTSEEIAMSITAVADASTRTSANAGRTKDASVELTGLATDLANLSRSNEPVPV